MLHSDIPADLAAEHATALPGIGPVSAPGQLLTRFKAPFLEFHQYCALVARDGGVVAE
jgi:hypothetical protein